MNVPPILRLFCFEKARFSQLLRDQSMNKLHVLTARLRAKLGKVWNLESGGPGANLFLILTV